jgi:acetyl esterase
MPLHPLARTFLDQRAALGVRSADELTVEAAREQAVRVARAMGKGRSVGAVEDRVIPAPHGEIPIRHYAPDAAGPHPVFVYFHGGGWVVGNLETVDVFCRMITHAAGCAVVSVNYRHAPEHKFPAAADDAYAATQWVAQHPGALGVDAARLAVGGTSAGGNLAAVVAQLARDRGRPPIALQLLIVPVIDYAFDTASYRENAEGYGLTTGAMRWFWRHYLRTEADGSDPRASPLRAQSLRGLPPAFVATAELDPLRDEGEAYAARLRGDGVPVTQRRYAGMIHGFLGPQADADIAAALRDALREAPATCGTPPS